MIEIKAPAPYTLDKPSVFLAGSIEQGKAEDWQAALAERLAARDIIILNPRRRNWDAGMDQRSHNAELVRQIDWELNSLDAADIVIFNLLDGTMSPISLLELGLCARKGRVFMCCPEAFWREANVEVVCNRFGIPFFHDQEQMYKRLEEELDIIT